MPSAVAYRAMAFRASGKRAIANDTKTLSIIRNGLVAEWRFDEGAGQVLTDYSGNGHHGQLGSTTGADAADPTWIAQGLSFDGGDRVDLPAAAPLGIDVVFKNDSTLSAALSPSQVLLAQSNNDETGVMFGNMSGGISNEIITIGQSDIDDDPGYSGSNRSYWKHASASIAAGSWHLLQVDWRSGVPNYTIVIDGTDLQNAVSGTPPEAPNLVEWIEAPWALGNGIGGVVIGGGGFQGDVAYLIFYSTTRTPTQQAQNRAALAAILAGRGITLP